MADEWEQYARKSGSDSTPKDEWAQYARKSDPETIAGLAPGQKLPGIHGPKVQMQEVSTPSTVASSFIKSATPEFLHNANPLNTVKAAYNTFRNPGQALENYKNTHDAEKQFDEGTRFLAEGDKRPVNANEIAADLGTKLGGEAGGMAQALITDGMLRGIHSIKAPIAERLRAEEARLDQAGIRPDERTIRNHFDNARSKNQSSGGVPINEAKDARFGRVENQISNMYGHPDIAPTFSDFSDLKSGLQKEAANGGFWDFLSPESKASVEAAGESSRAIRQGLRETPGAEDWAKLQDNAARRNTIDNVAGKLGGVIGAVAGPAVGIGSHSPIGTGLGVLGAKPGAELGQRIGRSVSNYFTSGRAANQLIKPLQAVTPKPFIFSLPEEAAPAAAAPFTPAGLLEAPNPRIPNANVTINSDAFDIRPPKGGGTQRLLGPGPAFHMPGEVTAAEPAIPRTFSEGPVTPYKPSGSVPFEQPPSWTDRNINQRLLPAPPQPATVLPVNGENPRPNFLNQPSPISLPNQKAIPTINPEVVTPKSAGKGAKTVIDYPGRTRRIIE